MYLNTYLSPRFRTTVDFMPIKKYIFLFCMLLTLNSCHVGRFFYWNFADTGDQDRFESVPIEKGGTPFRFTQTLDRPYPKLPRNITDNKGKELPFVEALETSGTTAFLVIKNDEILYENYFDGYTTTTTHPSFSVAKSFISGLIGIAIEEGHIGSLDDSVRKYLPDLDESFNVVTLAHIINMESGVKFSEGYFNPFGEVAKFYYGTNLKKFVKKLKVDKQPGSAWKYISGNSQLLSMTIASATGQPFYQYFQEKLWKPLGMESDATWNIDSKRHQVEKAFCCLNATARDFAKFGRLYLKKGNWEGAQVIPEAWVDQTTSFTDSVSHYIYSHHWWRNISFAELRAAVQSGQSDIAAASAPYVDYKAQGILGQFIYVHPEEDIIIVRLGHKFGKLDWAELFRDIVELNQHTK